MLITHRVIQVDTHFIVDVSLERAIDPFSITSIPSIRLLSWWGCGFIARFAERESHLSIWLPTGDPLTGAVYCKDKREVKILLDAIAQLNEVYKRQYGLR